jgi:hypothetical protein
MVGESGHLFESVRNLSLVADIARVKWGVMIPLNDVKDGYWVTAGDQSFNDMTTEETATSNDEERVAVC